MPMRQPVERVRSPHHLGANARKWCACILALRTVPGLLRAPRSEPSPARQRSTQMTRFAPLPGEKVARLTRSTLDTRPCCPFVSAFRRETDSARTQAGFPISRRSRVPPRIRNHCRLLRMSLGRKGEGEGGKKSVRFGSFASLN